ncbi:hypothetical protein [Orientia tsutsugamushi]|uniref:hypothetical protein n=1 Tax=Orientia tsutsugamushi TaxID=784 RepID=UPI0009BD1F33|nr:hypothetical protein [Orientia tsutsugamushi]
MRTKDENYRILVKKVYEKFKSYSYEIKQVQHYESVDYTEDIDKEEHSVDIPGIASFEQALKGYQLLIDCYLILSDNACLELEEMSYHINEMFKHRLYIDLADGFDRKYYKNLLSKRIDDIENKKAAYIAHVERAVFSREDGTIVDGKHATIVKYSKDDNGYYKIIYNAGYGVRKANMALQDKEELLKVAKITDYKDKTLNGYYSGIKYYIPEDISSTEEIEELITAELYDRAHQSSFNNPSAASTKLVTQQLYGNCTTRCIREALRDNIDEAVFRDLYCFITLVPYSSKLKMLEKLIDKPLAIGMPVLEKCQKSLTPKERFFSELQYKVNNILSINLDASIKNLQLIKLLDATHPLMLLDDGYQFLADVIAMKLIDADIIQENVDKSQATVLYSTDLYLNFGNLYNQGYNSITKKCLINEITTAILSSDIANQCMNIENIKYIVRKLFTPVTQDNDLYLTQPLLLPVKERLLQCIAEYNSKFTSDALMLSEDLNQVLNSWRNACLQDSKIASIIKAQIIGGDAALINVFGHSIKEEKVILETNVIKKGHVKEAKHVLDLNSKENQLMISGRNKKDHISR